MSAMKSLLRLAVTNVQFKCNKMWYTQSDGLALGTSLSVMLANLWMKSLKNPYRSNIRAMCTFTVWVWDFFKAI